MIEHRAGGRRRWRTTGDNPGGYLPGTCFTAGTP